MENNRISRTLVNKWLKWRKEFERGDIYIHIYIDRPLTKRLTYPALVESSIGRFKPKQPLTMCVFMCVCVCYFYIPESIIYSEGMPAHEV